MGLEDPEHMRRREMRRLANVCVRCGGDLAPHSPRHCQACLDWRNERDRQTHVYGDPTYAAIPYPRQYSDEFEVVFDGRQPLVFRPNYCNGIVVDEEYQPVVPFTLCIAIDAHGQLGLWA